MKLSFLAVVLLVLIPASTWAADPKASKYYEDALVRYEKKDLDGAIIQLKNALQIDRSMLSVQMLLGKALLRNGEVAAAEVALLESLRLGVNRAEVVPLLGQAFLAQGKQKQLFDRNLFGLPGLPPTVQMQVLLLQSAAHADLGNIREALQAVTEARAYNAKMPEVWLAEVPIRIRARQFREAKLAVDRALALAPDSIQGWYQKAAIAHVSGDLLQALAAYDRVVKLDIGNVEARIARAGLLVDLGRHADATRDVEELGKAYPKEPRITYLRALFAERDNKPEEARKALRDLTNLIDPVPLDFIRYRPQLLMLNGMAHLALGEAEKGKAYLEAFQRFQVNTPISKLLAQIYLDESRADRAIEVLDSYLRAQPEDGQAMILMGSALMAKGQNTRAITYMKRALQARDAPEFHTALGLGMIRSGQPVNAIPELEAAVKQNPGQFQAATVLITLYLRSTQTPKAVALAEKLVKQQPDNAEFFNLLGLAKQQSGKLADARSAFEEAIRLDGKLVSPRLNLARMDISDKAYDSAAKRLSDVLKTDEKNAEVMFEMAMLSERKGLLPEAQRWLEKAVDSASLKDVRWPLALSEFHLRYGRPIPALEAAKVASSRAPEDMLVLMNLARMQLANGDTPSARSTLSSATRAADYNAVMQVQIALLQLSANNAAGAAYSLEKALSSQPNYLPAQALMTEAELRLNEYDKAEKRARSILEKYPRRAVGFNLLGDISLARGKSDEALEFFRRAYKTEPSTETLLKLFRNLAGRDDKSALAVAEQWLKTHPKDALVLRAVADGQARSGNLSSARKSYENLVKLVPDDGAILNNLANVLFRQKDPSAIKLAEQAIERSPGNAYAIDTVGWIYLQSGATERALQLLREARLRAPDNPEIRYHLAVALSRSGRNSEAKIELSEALKARAGFEGIEEAKLLAKELGN